MKVNGPDYTGTVSDFHMEDRIDGDGVRYFEFAVDCAPDPEAPGVPSRIVFYINPGRPFSAACAGAVFVTWGLGGLVGVYHDPDDKANIGPSGNGHRVCAVVPITPAG